jgi:hypothetical protein
LSRPLFPASPSRFCLFNSSPLAGRSLVKRECCSSRIDRVRTCSSAHQCRCHATLDRCGLRRCFRLSSLGACYSPDHHGQGTESSDRTIDLSSGRRYIDPSSQDSGLAIASTPVPSYQEYCQSSGTLPVPQETCPGPCVSSVQTKLNHDRIQELCGSNSPY